MIFLTHEVTLGTAVARVSVVVKCVALSAQLTAQSWCENE